MTTAPDNAAEESRELDPEPRPPRASSAGRTVAVGVALTVAIVGALFTAAALTSGPPAPPGTPPPGEGRLGPVSGADATPLPTDTLAGFDDGDVVLLEDYRGRPLVVNFWASWCAPCIAEMPDFQEVFEQSGGRVAFLGVNTQDRLEPAREFVNRLGVTYDLAADPAAEYHQRVRGFGMPTTLLVDADGMIRYRHTGALDADQLRALLAAHLDIRV
jgi:cytochrome c biogenesis protein CcmG, thiol:disulfide interchange protein DsbE